MRSRIPPRAFAPCCCAASLTPPISPRALPVPLPVQAPCRTRVTSTLCLWRYCSSRAFYCCCCRAIAVALSAPTRAHPVASPRTPRTDRLWTLALALATFARPMAFYVLFALLALCTGQTVSPTTSPSPTPSKSVSSSSVLSCYAPPNTIITASGGGTAGLRPLIDAPSCTNSNVSWGPGGYSGWVNLQFSSPQLIGAVTYFQDATPTATSPITITGTNASGTYVIGTGSPLISNGYWNTVVVPVLIGQYTAVRLTWTTASTWISIANIYLRMYSCPIIQGYHCFSNALALCPAGSFCPQSVFTSSFCAKGSYSNAGAANCTLCPPGTFTSSTGSISCKQCPGGHYCPAGSSSWARLNCGRGNYCPDGSGAPTPCPYQVPPNGGWGDLKVQGPAFLVETAHCLNHCFWNFTSGDGMLSKC